MTSKDMKKTEAEATELKDEQLDDAQGGFTAPGDVAGLKLGEKKDQFNIDFQDGNDVIKRRTTEEHLRDHPIKK